MATKELKTYTLAQMKDKYIGKVGTKERDEYEYKLRMKKLDKFHYHEALDRTFCVTDIIENILMTHPVIVKHKKIKKKIKKAQKYLSKAYQMIGDKSDSN